MTTPEEQEQLNETTLNIVRAAEKLGFQVVGQDEIDEFFLWVQKQRKKILEQREQEKEQ